MNLTLEQIQRLAPNGAPLHLTLSEADQQVVVGTDRNFQFTVAASYGRDDFRQVRKAFQHYPDPVTINGQPLPTSPFPDLGRVALETYREGSANYHDNQEIQLSDTAQPHSPTDNACIAGIICRLNHFNQEIQHEHLTALPGPHQNWQALATVRTKPFWRIDQEEVDLLQTNGFNNLPETPPGSEIRQTIEARGQRQVSRTLDHPQMPQPADRTRIFSYVLDNGNTENICFSDPMPILVNGTPIRLPEDQDCLSTSIAVAEAMYRADCPFVPVQPHYQHQNWPHSKMEAYTFEIEDQADAPNPKESLAPAERITLLFRVQDDPEDIEHRVDAPLFMDEDRYEDKLVRYVPAKLTPSQLADCLFRGYLDETNCQSWDEVKEEASNLQERTTRLALSLLDNPVEAFRAALQKFANSFQSELNPVNVPLTETSRNGLITVCYQPKPAENTNPPPID